MINVFKTDDLWKAIIRPPKYKYVLSDLDQAQNSLKQVYALSRTDFELINKKNYKFYKRLRINRLRNKLFLYMYMNKNKIFTNYKLVV